MGMTLLFLVKKPICNIPEMVYGSKPTDGGHLLMDDDEKRELVKLEPESSKFLKPFISVKEFINNDRRWCLWLVNAEPSELSKLPRVKELVEAVKKMRLESTKGPTVKLANLRYLRKLDNRSQIILSFLATRLRIESIYQLGFSQRIIL